MTRAAALGALLLLALALAGPRLDALASGPRDLGDVEAQSLALLAALEADRTDLASELAAADVHLADGAVCGVLLPAGCIASPRAASLHLLARSRLAESTGRGEDVAAARALLYALESRNLTCADLPVRLLAIRALHQATLEVRLVALCEGEWAGYAPTTAEEGAWSVLAAIRLHETTGAPLDRARELALSGVAACAPPWDACPPREAGLWMMGLATLAGTSRDERMAAPLATLVQASGGLCGDGGACPPGDRAALAMGLSAAGRVLGHDELRARAGDVLNATDCGPGGCGPADRAWGALAEGMLAMEAPFPSFVGFRAEGLRLGTVPAAATEVPSPSTSGGPAGASQPGNPITIIIILAAVLVGALVLAALGLGGVAATAGLLQRLRGGGAGAPSAGAGAKEAASAAAPGGRGKGAAGPERKAGSARIEARGGSKDAAGKEPAGRGDPGGDEERREDFAAVVEYLCRRLAEGHDHATLMEALEKAGYEPGLVKDALAFALNEHLEERLAEGETREDVRAGLIERGFPSTAVDLALEESPEDYVLHLLHTGVTKAEVHKALADGGYDEGQAAAAISAAVDRFRKALARRGVGTASINETLGQRGFL